MSRSVNAPIEGNTNQSPPKRIGDSIKWVFTLHNYSKNDIDMFNNTFVTNVTKFLIFSEEVGKSGQTNHLQGYVEFTKRTRPFEYFSNKTIHWEKAKGSREDNIKYIRKEGGNVYFNGVLERKLKVIETQKLYPWQQQVVNLIKEEPNDRTINWYYEIYGNSGKSALVKYLCYNHGAIILSNKGSDMKYMIVKYYEKHHKYPEIIIIDIPRSIDLQYFSYTAVEEIKNGCFFSSKYECEQVLMNSPHILVFSNEEPEYSKMSNDRWNVNKIKID